MQVVVSLSLSVVSGLAAQPTLTFSGDEALQAHIAEYQAIWDADGERIIETLERVSRLSFRVGAVAVEVDESPSYAGDSTLILRASYSEETKRGTLVHELGHVLVGRMIPEDAPPGSAPTPHYVLNLFLYDVWVELWVRSSLIRKLRSRVEGGSGLPRDMAGGAGAEQGRASRAVGGDCQPIRSVGGVG